MEKAESKRVKKNSNKENQKSPKRRQNEEKKNKKPEDLQAPNSAKPSRPPRNRNRRERSRKENEFHGVKLVLRLLPPNLTEAQFLETLTPYTGKFSKCNVVDWYYVQGCYPFKLYSEPTYSRCYFIFGTIEQLKDFSSRVEQVKFTDDRNNSSSATLKVSPYVKRVIRDTKKTSRGSKSLEGRIQNDPLFKIFLDSVKLLEEKGSEYSLENICILKPMKTELAKQKLINSEIQSRTENAMTELTGRSKVKKRKGEKAGKKELKSTEKNSKKSSKTTSKSKVPEDAETGVVFEGKSKRKRSRKKKKEGKEVHQEAQQQNNVVILEAAGKRELRRRKKQQEAKAKTKNDSLPKRTEVSLSKRDNEPSHSKPKLLKKNEPLQPI